MQNDRLEYLFIRYYEKKDNDREREELMRLLQLIDNQEQVQQMIDILLQKDSDDYHLSSEIAKDILSSIFDVVSDPKEEIALIDSAYSFTLFKPLKTHIRMVAAASIIGFMVFAGYRLYHYRQADINTDMLVGEQSRNLPPGKEKAQLTLWDGTVIDLASIRNGELSQYAGVKIDSRGELIFNEILGETGYNVLTTPMGGQYKVMLPDGSNAWLNAGSSLRFPIAFTNSKRKVEMSGEVYFEIKSDKSRPFIVQIADRKTKGEETEITVLGTHFNVSSYLDESTIRTTLLEGAVEVRKGNSVKVLSPGQQARIPLSTAKAEIEIQTVDTEGVVAWKEGRFEFNGNIKDIMRQIARWYDVEVQYEGDVGNKDFVGVISRENNISEVLKMLELTGEIRFIIGDHKITVKNADDT